MPKCWWSAESCIHVIGTSPLVYTSQFAAGEQSLEWLDGKFAAARTKFEKDPKNHEAELKLKWQKEEEQQQEAAKNRKLVAQSSIKLMLWISSQMHLV
jgi:hypothetical protein